MSQFMVEFALPTEMSEEFVALIPQQRAKINELMEKGQVVAYALAADRQQLWCIIQSDSEVDVLALIAEFPLIDFMQPTIHPLAFMNVVSVRIPLFSLN